MKVQELVSRNLRRLRVERQISQDDLALMADVERAYVGHLERGTKNPTVVLLEKLADALDVEVHELLLPIRDGTPNPVPLKPGRKPQQ